MAYRLKYTDMTFTNRKYRQTNKQIHIFHFNDNHGFTILFMFICIYKLKYTYICMYVIKDMYLTVYRNDEFYMHVFVYVYDFFSIIVLLSLKSQQSIMQTYSHIYQLQILIELFKRNLYIHIHICAL